MLRRRFPSSLVTASFAASLAVVSACGPSAPANAPATSTTTTPTITPATVPTTAPADDADAGTPTSTAPDTAPAKGPTASATLEAKSQTKITGTARFVESGGQVEMTVTVKGAAPGDHGIHLHEKPDCSAADGASAGGHWNPDSAPHGGPTAASHHAGDFGNITVGADGTGTLTLTLPGLTVAAGSHSVVGHSVVVHANVDDLKTQPAGNAGARGACGVITAN